VEQFIFLAFVVIFRNVLAKHKAFGRDIAEKGEFKINGIMKDFELHGEWLVGGSSIWETGTLRFSQEQGAQLNLLHTKRNNYSFPSSCLFIHGRTGTGNVTLINCRNLNSHIWFYNDLGFQVYSAQYVFIGTHYNGLDEIIFQKVQFNLNNLSDWLDFSGLDYKSNSDDTRFTIEYSVPNSIEFILNENCKGKINLEYSGHFTYENERNITIKEAPKIEFIYQNGEKFEEILDDLIRFQNFLSILIYELSFPLFINFFQYKENTYAEKIQLYYKHPNYKLNFPQSNPIIFFKKLDNIFDTIICNWFSQYKKVESALSLFLSTLNEKDSFSTEKFLSIIKAIETFHINICSERESDNSKLVEKFERIINDIQLKKDKDYVKDLLYERLRPTLKERVNHFLAEYNNKYIEDNIKDLEEFKTKTSDSRNYYTHLDPKMKERALSATELYNLYIKLIALYLSVLYSYIGIEKTAFEDKLKEIFKE
jgi:hypothetical protein